MSDIEIQESPDFNMDEVDDMPGFVNQIDGVYGCKLSLSRKTEEINDKPSDRLNFQFTITEVIEEKKKHEEEVKPDDIVNVSFSLLLSEKDKETGRKQSSGLGFAKPHLVAIAKELDCGPSLNEIIKECQDVNCTVTFVTKTSKVKDADGNEKTYHNPNIRKLIFPA